jgi:DNA adenine methylase
MKTATQQKGGSHVKTRNTSKGQLQQPAANDWRFIMAVKDAGVADIAEALGNQYSSLNKPRIKPAPSAELRDQPLPAEVRPTVIWPSAAALPKPIMLDEVTAPDNTAGKGSYVNWAGSKAWSVQVIQGYLPPILGRAFFPFGGAASDAIGYADLFPEIYIADINQDLAAMHTWVASNPDDAIKALQQLFTPCNTTEEAFYQLRVEFNDEAPGTVRRSALFAYLLCHCFRGQCRYSKAGHFNGSYGYRKKTILPEAAIRHFSDKLGKACFGHVDALTTIAAAQSGDVVFLDPPYCPSTIGKKVEAQFTPFGFHLSDHEAMVREAELACARGATVFSHDHFTSETIALHPNATAVLPVKVARRIGGDRTRANEAIFIYRPTNKAGAKAASPCLTRSSNSANDENFKLDGALSRVVGSDCSFATE